MVQELVSRQHISTVKRHKQCYFEVVYFSKNIANNDKQVSCNMINIRNNSKEPKTICTCEFYKSVVVLPSRTLETRQQNLSCRKFRFALFLLHPHSMSPSMHGFFSNGTVETLSWPFHTRYFGENISRHNSFPTEKNAEKPLFRRS